MNVRGRLRTETSRTKTAGSTKIWFFHFFSQDSLMFVECPTSIRTCTARRLAVEDNDVLEDLKSQIYTPRSCRTSLGGVAVVEQSQTAIVPSATVRTRATI